MLSGPTTFPVMKEFGYICITRVVVVVSFTLPSEFQGINSGSKKQQQKDSYQSEVRGARCEVPFSVMVGHLENKGWHASSLLQIWHENEAFGNGWGCLSYLSGVKISDLVPFTVSQPLLDYQRPSWYLLGWFSLNKIPEISITKTILMIWLEPLEHIEKRSSYFWDFSIFCV